MELKDQRQSLSEATALSKKRIYKVVFAGRPFNKARYKQGATACVETTT